jgi:hypothetical protein
MSIEVLAAVIIQHGFRARIVNNELYGEMHYSNASGSQSVWEPIKPTVTAVKRWLGY